MNLSEHFTLEEFTRSDTAERLDIDNTPDAKALANLRATAAGMETIRLILDKPVLVSSGYRSPALNAAIGGSKTSQHIQGLACDFTCPEFGTPLQVCRKLLTRLEFDQLIYEHTWVHVSFAPALRGQALTLLRGGKYSDGIG